MVKPKWHKVKYGMYSLCDSIRAVRTERVIDGYIITGTVILYVEGPELDNDGVAFRSTDLPLASGVSWVSLRVFRRCKFFAGGVSHETVRAFL